MKHKLLCGFYLLLSLSLLIYGWYPMSYYFHPNLGLINGFIHSQILMLQDAMVNPLAKFLVIEDVVVVIVIGCWIYFEDKTIKNGFFIIAFIIWMYIFSIGVYFSLFMSIREYKLWKQSSTENLA